MQHRRFSKFLALFLAVVFLSSFMPQQVEAQNNPVSLEQAIQTAKQLFPATQNYSSFVSEFSSSPQSSTWNLHWEASESGQGNITVQINAQTGEVVSMWHWTPEQPGQNAGASLSTIEARNIADQWLKKLLPEKYSHFRLIDQPTIIPLSNNNYSSVEVRYQCYENGLRVIGDEVRMEVNARNRSISSYNLNWLDRPLPNPGKAISSTQARQVFQGENMLQMQYFLPRNWLKSSLPDPEPIRLIYRVNHPSQGSIDALTGKPLVLKDGQYEYAYDMAAKESASGMGGAPASPLTPQEIAELEKNSQILSQEEAITKLKQWVNIPNDAVLNNANLSRDWQNRERRIWNFNWSQSQSSKDLRGFGLWAQVDATTGRIYGFSRYTGEEAAAASITRDEAAAAADKFIARIEPGLVKALKLDEESAIQPPQPLVEEKLPSQWTLHYTRQVEGIPFPVDGIQITVSGEDKQVSSYNLSWADAKFPAAAKAMSAADAYQTYWQYAPMTLCYSPVASANDEREFKLVYKPLAREAHSDFAMIDAVSGAALNNMGSAANAQPSPRSFNDIAGHWAEKEITLIGQAGLMNEYGPQFKPGEPITTVGFLRAMIGAWDGVWSLESMDDNRVMTVSRERGWLKENVDPQTPLSRQQMVRIVIRGMGLEKAARYGAVYKNPFPDDKSIDESLVGYVALANGMGLLHLDKGFNASQTMTRGEAAFTLARSVKL